MFAKVCIMKNYTIVHLYEDGVAVIKYKKNIFSKLQWGVRNENGETTLFAGEFEDVIILSCSLIARKVNLGKDNFKWELTKWNGQKICPPKYDNCPEWIIKDKLLFAPANNLIALIDNAGHQLCKPRYMRLRPVVYTRERDAGIACEGVRNGLWYKININGVELKTEYHQRY